jgi:hypothetical protein
MAGFRAELEYPGNAQVWVEIGDMQGGCPRLYFELGEFHHLPLDRDHTDEENQKDRLNYGAQHTSNTVGLFQALTGAVGGEGQWLHACSEAAIAACDLI